MKPLTVRIIDVRQAIAALDSWAHSKWCTQPKLIKALADVCERVLCETQEAYSKEGE